MIACHCQIMTDRDINAAIDGHALAANLPLFDASRHRHLEQVT